VLACAALLPDLVTAAASLGSYAPYDADGLDSFAGMGQAIIDEYRLLLTDPDAARAGVDKGREEDLATSVSDLAQALGSFLAPADAAVLNDELAGYLTCTNHVHWRLAARDGGTTSAPRSTRGGSNWPKSPSRSCSCTAGRTSSSPSHTANGWPPTSRGPKPGCSTTTGT
jgi:hypothetical protein